MTNKAFMDLVAKTLRASKGRDLPAQCMDESMGWHYVQQDQKRNETQIGINSGICEGTINIDWGVEVVFPKMTTLAQVSKVHIKLNAVERGYVSIHDPCRRPEVMYRLASTDFETVTDVLDDNGLRLWCPSRKLEVPDLQGQPLEQALPILFNTFYERTG